MRAQGWAAETQKAMSCGTRAQRRGRSVRPSRRLWQAGLQVGDRPGWWGAGAGAGGQGRAARCSRAGRQPGRGGADRAPWRFPPSVVCMAQAPASNWEAKELDLAPAEGRHHGGRGPAHGPPTQEGDLCGQSPRGHTPQLFLCSHQGQDLTQLSALSYGKGVEAPLRSEF